MSASLLILAGVLGTSPGPADGPARYYVLLFGGSSNIIDLRTGHTWATFVRVRTAADGSAVVDPVTISWLPATLRVRPLHFNSEPGVNLTLAETLAQHTGRRSHVALFGPYETSPEVYFGAVEQAAQLDSGFVRYQLYDRFGQRPEVSHCIHAVTRVAPAWKEASDPVYANSEIGTAHIARKLLRTGTGTVPVDSADWLLPALGLQDFPLHRRTLWIESRRR